MKRIVKPIILAIVLTLMFALPVLAEETTNTATMAQKIENVRSLEMFGMITIDARIFNLITEIQIHKLKVEPDSKFAQIAQSLMFPIDDTLTLKGRRFNCIALMSSYGFLTDDEAIEQLQALILVQ